MANFYFPSYDHPVTKLITPDLDLSSATAPQLNFSFSNVDWGASFLNDFKVYYRTSPSSVWSRACKLPPYGSNWSNRTINLPNASSSYAVAFEVTNNYGKSTTLDAVSVTDATLGTVFENGFELGPNSFGGGAKMIGVS